MRYLISLIISYVHARAHCDETCMCVCVHTPGEQSKNLAASEIFLQHFDACARVTLSLNNFAQQWESPSKQGVLTASAALGDPGPRLAL